MTKRPFPTLLIIPTGIGCPIGGFAGDAIPVARLLAASSGCLITHPNVMNGASLYWPNTNIHYVEGYSLDRFAVGDLILRPVREQKVGLLFDAGLEVDLRHRHLQVADACNATLGLKIGPCITTERPLGITLQQGSSGSSWGNLEDPDVLLRAANKLKQNGATAIAVVTRFPDEDESISIDLYREGNGVDIIAGAEAVISHLLVKELCLPCAHAPALLPMPINFELDPRAAGEEIGYTFLTSVLVGLSTAPDLIHADKRNIMPRDVLSIDDVGAIVVPNGALGSEAVLACIEKGIPLIRVENQGVLNVTAENLGIHEPAFKNEYNIFNAKNYVEAAGLITALREGISISSLNRPIKSIAHINRLD